MAKKRVFASDSDVSLFISRKQNHTEVMTTKERQQVTIYPDKDVLKNVKILAKVKDLNLNSMFLALIRETIVVLASFFHTPLKLSQVSIFENSLTLL